MLLWDTFSIEFSITVRYIAGQTGFLVGPLYGISMESVKCYLKRAASKGEAKLVKGVNKSVFWQLKMPRRPRQSKQIVA